MSSESITLASTDSPNVKRIHLRGNMNVFRAGELAAALDIEPSSEVSRIVVDLQDVGTLESAAVAVLSIAHQQLHARNISLVIENPSDEHLNTMRMMPAADLDKQQPELPGSLENTGAWMIDTFDRAAEFVAITFDATIAILRTIHRNQRPPKGSIIEQSMSTGVEALPIILLLSALIGLILGFQAAYQLEKLGANIFIADIVGIMGVREFSPLISAIIIAGRSGASIAAELGTMTVQEEVDALRSMGLNPIRFLVLPRISGLIITLPALTLISSFIVIAGGGVIGTTMLGLQPFAYVTQAIKVITFSSWVFGLSKAVVFAWIIALVASYSGLSIRGGASEVGNATTRSVVISIFLLIVIDSIFAMVSTMSQM